MRTTHDDGDDDDDGVDDDNDDRDDVDNNCTVMMFQVNGLQLQYKLHMTNGEEGDLWHYEFSADEFCELSRPENKCIVKVPSCSSWHWHEVAVCASTVVCHSPL